MNLKDKVVVITGGSQGFGKELAKEFIKNSSRVVISSDDPGKLEVAKQEINCESFVADVMSAGEIQKLADYTVNAFGRIDIWVNNAGVQIAPSIVEKVDIEKLRQLFGINFFGYFYGMQVALSQMKKQGFGAIINVNSTAGLSGKPELSAYCSSKFAIKGLTESARQEVNSTDIKIYGVFPGGMQTEIYKEKYPTDFDEYMPVQVAIDKVMNNLKSADPELDLVIKRPTK